MNSNFHRLAIRVFFGFVLIGIIAQGVIAVAIYNECVASGDKKCLAKTMREFSGRGYNVSVE